MQTNEYCRVTSNEDLGGIEIIEAQFTDTVFGKHAHSDFTIAIVDAGVMHFSHRGSSHNALPRQISIVSSDELHTGSKGRGEGWRYRALCLPQKYINTLSESLFGQNQTPYFSQSVITNLYLSQQMQLLLDKLSNNSEELDIEECWEVFLVNLLRQESKQSLAPTFLSAQSNITSVRDYLADCYHQKVSLEFVAQQAGISKFHLIREFKRYYQLTPHQFQIQQRLHHARTQLKGGSSCADVALNCGFYDQSHFSKVFVNAMGVTPNAYQQQLFTR